MRGGASQLFPYLLLHFCSVPLSWLVYSRQSSFPYLPLNLKSVYRWYRLIHIMTTIFCVCFTSKPLWPCCCSYSRCLIQKAQAWDQIQKYLYLEVFKYFHTFGYYNFTKILVKLINGFLCLLCYSRINFFYCKASIIMAFHN